MNMNNTKEMLAEVFKAVEEAANKRISAKNRSLGTKAYYDKARAGFSPEIAIQATLSVVAENTQAWEAGMDAFIEAPKLSIPTQESPVTEEASEIISEAEIIVPAPEMPTETDTPVSEEPVEIAGIERAVAAVTDDEEIQDRGVKTYIEAIRSGQSVNDALSTSLDTMTNNESAWLKGQAAFYEETEAADVHTSDVEATSSEGSENKAMWWAIAAILAIIAIIIGATFLNNHKTVEKVAEPVMVDRIAVLEKATLALYKAGWKPGEFVLDNAVDPSKDGSTGGQGSFKADGVKNAEEMVTFLGSGSEAANAVVSSFANADTGASKEDVLNPNNWVTVQSLKKFSYPGNTLLRNGEVANAGARKGSANDIFLLFVSPNPDAVVSVKPARGGCVNPQSTMPTPVPTIPEEVIVPEEPAVVIPPTEVYLQPKSSDPDDYKYPAKKPEVDANKKADKKAPEVDTKVEGASGVVDKPTNEPGSESGVLAADAEIVDEDVREKAPEEEKGVNPTKNDETNVADPGLPQGF